MTYPLFGAEDDAGNVKDDGQGHFSNLTQLLLLVRHADGYGVDQNQRIHTFGAILFTVKHGRAGLATKLVGRQQEGACEQEGWVQVKI